MIQINACKVKMINLMNWITLKATVSNHLKESDFRLSRLGTDYGGWWIPSFASGDQGSKVLLSVGLGYDVSFDSELVSRGFRVIGLDQQSECVEYAKTKVSSEQATFLCRGLGVESGLKRFYAPRNPSHDSWSMTNAQNTSVEKSKLFNVISFRELCGQFPEITNSSFSMLKMDVEGAELPILSSIYRDLNFDFIGVEMDCLILIPFLNIATRIRKVFEVRKLITSLESQGYKLILLDNFNFFFTK
jgi:FkbM family methyltransferase